jgi:hypothetical protein
VPLVQDDARIGSPSERMAHAVYWKNEHATLDSLIRKHGGEVVGAEVRESCDQGLKAPFLKKVIDYFLFMASTQDGHRNRPAETA